MDDDLVELRDGQTTISILTLTSVFATLAAPFIIGLLVAMSCVNSSHYSKLFLQQWYTIAATGAISFFGVVGLQSSARIRKEFPFNFAILAILCIVQGMFLGGLCSHSYISIVVLGGICLALSSLTVGAALASITGKSRKLKKFLFWCIWIGFAAYVVIFVVVQRLMDSSYSFTYREVIFWSWVISYAPFTFYFPYALVLFVLPEQEDPDDFIQASITVWTHCVVLFFRVC